jgi:Anti-sigma-K factor rskA, C-terminal
MNGHPQFAEALALYAMGSLDDPQDLAALQAHLGTCGECRGELEALRADMALLALSTTGPQPPARSRQRLLSAIAEEPRLERRDPQRYSLGRLRPRWFSFAPVVVMLLLAVFSLLLWRDVRRKEFQLRVAHKQIEQMQAEVAKQKIALDEARKVGDLLHASDAWPLTLVSLPTPPQPQMKLIYSRQKGSLLLMANNAPQLPEDKIYELWLLPADGSAPMPAGWFKPDKQGHGMIFHTMTAGIDAKGFAVTIEPSGGSQTPTPPIKFAPAG